jgi:hypothetical protein
LDDSWKFLTVLVSGIALWVATHQWWISRERLRLDLFEKRYAVYAAVRDFIRDTVNSESSAQDRDASRTLTLKTGDAVFLFEADIQEYINSISRKALEYQRHKQIPIARQQAMHPDIESDMQEGLIAQSKECSGVFARYLQFQDLQGPLAMLVRVTKRGAIRFHTFIVGPRPPS